MLQGLNFSPHSMPEQDGWDRAEDLPDWAKTYSQDELFLIKTLEIRPSCRGEDMMAMESGGCVLWGLERGEMERTSRVRALLCSS